MVLRLGRPQIRHLDDHDFCVHEFVEERDPFSDLDDASGAAASQVRIISQSGTQSPPEASQMLDCNTCHLT